MIFEKSGVWYLSGGRIEERWQVAEEMLGIGLLEFLSYCKPGADLDEELLAAARHMWQEYEQPGSPYWEINTPEEMAEALRELYDSDTYAEEDLKKFPLTVR